MRQVYQQQQPQPQQQYRQFQQHPIQPHLYYNPRTQIPVGRPLNESTNSSFATEYPTLWNIWSFT